MATQISCLMIVVVKTHVSLHPSSPRLLIWVSLLQMWLGVTCETGSVCPYVVSIIIKLISLVSTALFRESPLIFGS